MSLVEYSQSSSGSESADAAPADDDNAAPQPAGQPSKRRRIGSSDKQQHGSATAIPSSSLPPLPDAFRDLYATNARLSTRDDPQLHGGRKRAMPHVEGNWPAHVYLEWHPSETEIRTVLEPLIDSFKPEKNTSSSLPSTKTLHSLLKSDVGAPQPLHISLSATLALQFEQRDAFATSLARSINEAPAVKPFQVRFTGLRWVPNEQRNRWFLVLVVARPAGNELNRLLLAANSVASKYNLPTLYAEKTAKTKHRNASVEEDWTDMFHFSLAWSLDEPESSLASEGGLEEDKPAEILDKILQLSVQFVAVKLKIGNEVRSLPLGSQQQRPGGILG